MLSIPFSFGRLSLPSGVSDLEGSSSDMSGDEVASLSLDGSPCEEKSVSLSSKQILRSDSLLSN